MKEHEETVDEFEERLKQTYRRESDQEQIDTWVEEFRGAMEQRFAKDEERDVEEIREEERSNMNINLVLSLVLSIFFIVISAVYRARTRELADSVKGYVTSNLGWFFVLLSTGAVIYLGYLAFSRFGDVVLGDPEERPEFGDISWYSMLFSAGMGVGILFWGAAEPLKRMLKILREK